VVVGLHQHAPHAEPLAVLAGLGMVDASRERVRAGVAVQVDAAVQQLDDGG
jgi:hypothetical protein